jgi:hypothetical protein
MNMRRVVPAPIVLVPFFVSVACGGESPPAATPKSAPAASADATGHIAPETPAQHKLAHFRTADGMIGLTLDRSGDKPKYQVDGQKDIVEMTMKPDRENWGHELQGYFLVAPDGKRPFFIDESGGVTYNSGNDHYALMWDKDVPALGAPTVTGAYTEPVPAYKIAGERLNAIAVRTKFPQFKAEDSANLSKVGDAVSMATKEMFVHFAARGDKDASLYRRIVPQSFDGVSFGGVGYTSDEAWNPKATGLAKYGGRNEGFSHYDTPKGNHMQVMTLDGYKPALADGTPGLVWEIDGTNAVFVTLDGDRYEVGLAHSDKGATLDAGTGPTASWPSPAQDALLTVHDVSSLAKAGALPQKAADDLLGVDEDWTKCAAGVWAGAERVVDTLRFTDADRKDYEKKVRTKCASFINKQEAMILGIVEARLKDRLALLAKAKARVSSVAADK